MSEMDQEDIDKLLADALGGDDDNEDSTMGQDDIDALLAEASDSADDTPMGQDDIDAMLAQANGDSIDEAGPMGQDDIDAMLAQANDTTDDTPMGQDDIDAMLAEANGGSIDEAGPMGQDDIDAMLAQANGTSDDAPMEQNDIDTMLAETNNDIADEGVMGQDDIDSLLANAIGADDDADEGSLVGQNGIDDMLEAATDNVMGQDDIDALLSGGSDELDSYTATNIGDNTSNNDDEGAMEQDDIDALLAGAIEDSTDSVLSESDTDNDNMVYDEDESEDELSSLTGDDDTFDISNDLSDLDDIEEDEIINESPDYSDDIQESIVSQEPLQAAYTPPPMQEIKPSAPRPAPQLTEEQMLNIQESLSLSGSSGEVENLAGQMSGLLGQLSERARRFQAAWLTADQETRELRHAINLSQQKVHVLSGEKQSLHSEINTLRKQYSQVEGEKLASSEAHRTEIASLELQLREQESRNNMILSEIRTLKEELERARNETTGSDIESRRSRFELERINSELSSERQERQRLARALENREKELQAMQAQSAGHASTLFLDELHRLVRRLESELDVRTSSAHEALSVIDRIEFHPEQQMYASTLRSAIASAAGITPDESDALKILDNQSKTGHASLEPSPPPGADSFNSALERYDFAKASGIASASMRSGEKTPLDFIREIHQSAVLKRPEIGDYLDDLSAMIRGIKSLQEASDRARGKEGENTEMMYVLIFDLLHTFVRMKLISRATTSIWDLFLELRGRFSFLTSDRQWKEYRDRLLSSYKVNA